MKTTQIATALIALFMSTYAFAGATNTKLSCASADGKITMDGEVPGDFSEFDLTVKIKNETGVEKLRLFSKIDQETSLLVENGRVAVVEDLEKGVFTVRAEGINQKSYGVISLYAIPKTVKVQDKNGAIQSAFTGHLTVYTKVSTEEEDVTCSTKYAL